MLYDPETWVSLLLGLQECLPSKLQKVKDTDVNDREIDREKDKETQTDNAVS